MGRGTDRMSYNGKPCGKRPRANIWKHRGQWWGVVGSCWTGWHKVSLSESEVMERLARARAIILADGAHHGYGKYWETHIKPQFIRARGASIARWAASLGVPH